MELNELFLRRVIQIAGVKIDGDHVLMKILHLKGEDEESWFILHLMGVQFLHFEVSNFSRYASLDVDDKQLSSENGVNSLMITNPSLEFECRYLKVKLEEIHSSTVL